MTTEFNLEVLPKKYFVHKLIACLLQDLRLISVCNEYYMLLFNIELFYHKNYKIE